MQRTLRAAAATGVAAVLLAGCSIEGLIERALSQVEGVEGVEIDRESGSFAIRGEDGEVLAFELDDEQGGFSVQGADGSFSTTQTDQLPPEIAAVFTPPDSFQPALVSEIVEDGTRGITVQGPIIGDWATLMDDLEARANAGDWTQVERQTMGAGVMGAIIAVREGDPELTLNVSLIMEENSENEEGILSLLLLRPPSEAERAELEAERSED